MVVHTLKILSTSDLPTEIIYLYTRGDQCLEVTRPQYITSLTSHLPLPTPFCPHQIGYSLSTDTLHSHPVSTLYFLKSLLSTPYLLFSSTVATPTSDPALSLSRCPAFPSVYFILVLPFLRPFPRATESSRPRTVLLPLHNNLQSSVQRNDLYFCSNLI